MRFVLIGGPGSGKDTLVDSINDYTHNKYIMISPGSILRDEAQKGTELGIYARDQYWGKGNLCPDNLINDLVKQSIDSLDHDSIIFNGYPRTVGQAIFLDNIMPIHAVVDLDVDKDIAVQRLLKRGRSDDNQETIATRFIDYQNKTDPLRDYYKANNYIKVDASTTPDQVLKQLNAALNI